MYKIKVLSNFSGAHNLRGYKGKCEELHGHNWRVEVTASADELDDIGMVADFKVLKQMLANCIKELDHRHLNEVEYFKKVNPTSENIARYIYQQMSRKSPEVKVQQVTVWETDTSSATYSE